MRFIGDFIGADFEYNSLGHRCRDINQIDLDNYILFTGCSHTLGEGLEIEQSFPFLVANRLKMDYYNLGLSGSGIDILLFNLCQWFNVIEKKPKLLVIQYPDYTRFSSILDDSDNIIPKGNWDNAAKRFIVDGVDNGFFSARKKMAVKQIESFDVPIITFVHGNTIPYSNDNLRMRHLDYANDGLHSGVKSHKEFSSIIVDLFVDKY